LIIRGLDDDVVDEFINDKECMICMDDKKGTMNFILNDCDLLILCDYCCELTHKMKKQGICEDCGEKHRNRSDNLCGDCRLKTRCNRCNIKKHCTGNGVCQKCLDSRIFCKDCKRYEVLCKGALCETCKKKYTCSCGENKKPDFSTCYNCVKRCGCGERITNPKYKICYTCNQKYYNR